MMLSSPGAKERTYPSISQINVTPLVDVVLVLLIIFLVTAPMLHSSVDVDLPTIGPAAQQEQERLVISVNRQRQIHIADQPVAFQLLPGRLRAIQAGSARAVALRADRALDYGYVLLVLDAIRRAGIEDVGLVVNPVDAAAPLAATPSPASTGRRPGRSPRP